MTGFWYVGAALLALTSGAAFAQSAPFDATNSTRPNMSTNGPAGTYDTTTTRRSVDQNGNATETTQGFEKSQSYGSGDGTLRAHTVIRTTAPTTRVIPTPTQDMPK